MKEEREKWSHRGEGDGERREREMGRGRRLSMYLPFWPVHPLYGVVECEVSPTVSLSPLPPSEQPSTPQDKTHQ